MKSNYIIELGRAKECSVEELWAILRGLVGVDSLSLN